MIDLKLLRENPDALRASQRARGADPGGVDVALSADQRRRDAVGRADSLRAEQRQFGKKIGQAKGDERTQLLVQAKELAAQVKSAEAEQTEADQALADAQRGLANLIIDGVPEGGEDDYVVLEHVGTPREFDFEVKDHLELLEPLGGVDMERGAKVAGARFFFLTGIGAQLQLALLNLAMSRAVANGFTMMVPPVLVKPEIMEGTGFLGAHASEVYHLGSDDLYLVGTSEVPLAGYHADEILDLSKGPRRYAGWSTCFRREAGSYGKDTRGMIRVHQFDKIEMFSYCKPENAIDEHQRLLGWEREMLGAIEVPYRIIDTAAGDLGSSAARKYDCEAWLPSQNRYRELTSTSNCTTFQARRLNIRYRDDEGRSQTVATLNGTLATTRWIVAIVENHQNADGSVTVPQALRPFLGHDVLTPSA